MERCWLKLKPLLAFWSEFASEHRAHAALVYSVFVFVFTFASLAAVYLVLFVLELGKY